MNKDVAKDGFEWMPPAWVMRVSRPLTGLIAFIATFLAYYASEEAGYAARVRSWPALATVVLGWMLAMVVHEGGHLAAARCMGMLRISMRLGPFDLRARRKGWSIRWKSASLFGGHVMALADPDRRLWPQYVVFVAAGPLANFAVGALLAFAGVASKSPVWLPALMGLAIINVGMGAWNLLPFQVRFPSDGLQLLMWCRRPDERSPNLAFLLLAAWSMKGRTADELPRDWLDALSEQGPQSRLVRLWYDLKAHQNRREWDIAAGLAPSFDALMAELPAKVADAYRDFASQMRMEFRFSACMAGLAPGTSCDPRSRREIDWCAPSTRPRCEALEAFETGDRALAERKLALSERHAENARDLAHRRSEAMLRQALREKYAA